MERGDTVSGSQFYSEGQIGTLHTLSMHVQWLLDVTSS